MADRLESLSGSLIGFRDPPGTTRHFTEDEEHFIRLPGSIHVSSFPIHHDVRRREPDDDYVSRLYYVVDQLVRWVPELFADTSFEFDPARTLRPVFSRPVDDAPTPTRLVVHIDLAARPGHADRIEPARNNYTSEYYSRDVFVEIDLVPTVAGETQPQRLINETWIGERGRGYFAQGIWIDRDLTKFLSALVEPEEHPLYPYYPFSCRFRSVTHAPPAWSGSELSRAAQRLSEVLAAVTPWLREIESVLRGAPFSRELELFRSLREAISDWVRRSFGAIRTRAYLTEEDRKEYVLEVE